MSDINTLYLAEQDDGDIVICTYAPRDNFDKSVEICTSQGGSRLTHNVEVLEHFRAIMDLLEPDNIFNK